jgi:hypothetical protein
MWPSRRAREHRHFGHTLGVHDTCTRRRFAPRSCRDRRLIPSLVALALALGLLCLPRQAQALGPLDVEVGAKAGAGSNPGGTGGPNPLGFGLGGRAGVSLRGLFGLYAGVNFVYYLGSNQSVGTTLSGLETTSSHSVEYGFELGYGYRLGPVTLRGQVGVGSFEIDEVVAPNRPSTPGGFPGSERYLYFEPGVVGLVSIGFVFVGADVNGLLLPLGPSNPIGPNGTAGHALAGAVTAHGQVGVKF